MRAGLGRRSRFLRVRPARKPDAASTRGSPQKQATKYASRWQRPAHLNVRSARTLADCILMRLASLFVHGPAATPSWHVEPPPPLDRGGELAQPSICLPVRSRQAFRSRRDAAPTI